MLFVFKPLRGGILVAKKTYPPPFFIPLMNNSGHIKKIVICIENKGHNTDGQQ